MAGPAMTRIDDASVAAVRVGEGAPQPIRVQPCNDYVHMIGHQAVAPYFCACPVCRRYCMVYVAILRLINY